MSLQNLPEEVFDLIVSPLATQELVSLTLTSKRILASALPFLRARLYRRVELVISYRYALRERSIERERQVRDLFFRTIRDHPACGTFIEELSLAIDPSLLAEETIRSVVQLLGSSTRLKILEIRRAKYYWEEEIPVEIIQAVPQTITKLKLVSALPTVQQLQILFDRLPKLRALDLTDARKFEPIWDSLRLPSGLLGIEIPYSDFNWHPFLGNIILGPRHLVVFTGSFISLEYLAQRPLAHLRLLRIINPPSQLERLDPSCSYIDCLTDLQVESLENQLVGILQRTTSLETLHLYSWYEGRNNKQLQLLKYLPRTLVWLNLWGRPFLPADPLVAYLVAESQSPNLQRLGLCGWNLDLPEEPVLSICKERQIDFRNINFPQSS